MALIVRDAQGGLSVEYRAALENLAKGLIQGKCVLFLGAGASIAKESMAAAESPKAPTAVISGNTPGEAANPISLTNITRMPKKLSRLPSGPELSREMAARCELDWHQAVPLPVMAFYFESFFTREGLIELLKERIGNPEAQISATTHTLNDIVLTLEERALQEKAMPPTIIFTTNYDRHFERSYKEKHANRRPANDQDETESLEVLIYKGATNPNSSETKLHFTSKGSLGVEYWQPTGRTVLYKIHGCISQPEGQGLVITEEDYINFLANALDKQYPEKQLPNYLRGRLALSKILFVGYSLADWNFRALFKGTVEPRLSQKTDRSYAVQLRSPDAKGWDAMVKFWHEKKVDILDVDAQVFSNDLYEALEEHGLHGRSQAAAG